jgi:hypothetical protein
MNGSSMHRDTSSLEAKVASELSAFLEKTSIESTLKVEPSADLLYLLELYIPQLLSRHYPEWEKESLDGFFLANARRIGSETAEFAGLCILISDQSVAPVFTRLALTSSHDSIASYQVFLGEPGGGHLGISGPPCNSPQAQRLLETVGARLNNIRWS